MDSGYIKSLEIRGIAWRETCTCGAVLSESKANAYTWDRKDIVTPGGCGKCDYDPDDPLTEEQASNLPSVAEQEQEIREAQKLMGRLGFKHDHLEEGSS